MAERFENLDNTLRDWQKIRNKKVLPRHSTGSRSQKRKIKPFLLENDTNNFLAASVGSRERLNHAQTWSWQAKNHCFISNLTNPIDKMFLRLIYLKNSTFPSVKTTVDVRNETAKHHFLKSVK